MEKRYYIVSIPDVNGEEHSPFGFAIEACPKEDFITESERQGKVYSEEGFIKAFNDGDINTCSDSLRIY